MKRSNSLTRVLFAFGLSLALLSGVCNAQSEAEPVTLISGMEPVPLAGHIAVLRDDNREWTLSDVQSSALASQFVRSDAAGFNFGFSRDAYWYRLTLRNPAGQDGRLSEWVLDQRIPTLSYVDIHVTRGDGSTESTLTGDLRQAPANQLPHRTFAVPLRMAPGEQVTVHVRAQTTGRHQVYLALWTNQGFLAKATEDSRLYGLFYGVWLVMALYNLLIFAAIRDRAYLYYVFFIMAMIGATLTLNGEARQYGNSLSASAPAWISASRALWGSVLSVFAILFGREFLLTRQHVPRVHRLTTFLAMLGALSLLLYPVFGHVVTGILGLLIAVISFLTLLAVSIYLSLRGVRAAYFYLLAWGVLIVAIIFFALSSFGGLLPGLLTAYAVPIGVCVAVTLLSLALADRINQERKEKFAARENATRLKSFLPQKVAELVTEGGNNALLEPKRRQITVCVIDLRGFTPFSETSAPEDVMAVLRTFFDTMGKVVEQHGGTVEHFAGDSMLIFFNAPLEFPEPEKQAVQAALAMRAAFEPLRAKWTKLGHELGLGIGIADGYATIGAIGFSGRSQYAAIGAVTNLASRLCSSAQHGEILTTSRVLATVESLVESESAGEHTIKGFHRPIQVVRLLGIKNVPGESRLVALEG